MLEFREVLLLLLAILAIPLYMVMRRPSGRLKFSSLSIWPKNTRSFKSRTAFVPPLLLSLAFIALVVALAGPRIPGGSIRQYREGIAMMLVVDKSGSMAALDMSREDVELDRLGAVKETLRAFVLGDGKKFHGRPDDAIGLVSFASFPDSDAPLTLDHVTLMSLIEDLQIVTDRNEGATAIGDALAQAGERLRESKQVSKVVVLLTDGVNNTGYEEPIDAARMLVQLGIKVYTVGVGTMGFAPVRVEHPLTGRKMIQQVPVDLDEPTLIEIAEMTGGSYFRATDHQKLGDIYAQIDALEKTRISEDRLTHYDEHYVWALMAAWLLALLGILLSKTYYRRAP